MSHDYDLAVVGAGIVGPTHALAAARSGTRGAVLGCAAWGNDAVIRDFAFVTVTVTVTGQRAWTCWTRAMRSHSVWAEIIREAGFITRETANPRYGKAHQ